MDPNPTPLPPVPSQPVIPPVTPAPPTPVKPNNWLVTLLIIFVVLLSLGAAGFLAFQNVQLKNQIAQITPTPRTSPRPTTETGDMTENWETYTNNKNLYSVNIPPGWEAERGNAGGKYTDEQLQQLDRMFWRYNNSTFSVQVLEDCTNLNTCFKKFQAAADASTDTGGRRYNTMAFRTTRGIFQGIPSIESRSTYDESVNAVKGTFFVYKDKLWLIETQSLPTLKETDQILSTFKFLNIIPTASETTVPAATLVPTVGWKKSSALTFSVLYPPEYSPFSSDDMINFRHTQNPEQVAVINISRDGDPQTAKPYSMYTGQSRRIWWIKSQYDTTHPQPANLRFVEKMLGTIDGLEIYIGDSLQTILVVHGDKLYQIGGQNEIINVPTLETITSTLTFQ
jgi:hypothetical protein